MVLPLVCLSLWLSLAAAVYIKPDNQDLSAEGKYDYVIVGGGIGGIVMANRLSEDPSGKFE